VEQKQDGNMTTQNRFPTIKKGTTFNGRDIKFFNVDGTIKTPMPLDGVTITMDFEEVGGNNKIFSFTTTDNSITKTGVGVARMMPRLMNIPRAVYETTLLLDFGNGIIKPYGDKLIWKIE
jgi:hypothetical protein